MNRTKTSRSAPTVKREISAFNCEEDIRRIAYRLYELRGRADGHALEDWLRAEELVKQTRFRSTAA